jgi:hypothetical protein
MGELMAWSKIDEDRGAYREAWSAFLLKGLIDNANAYGSELAPGFTAVWAKGKEPTWASMEAFAGGVLTFNVGRDATAAEFVATFDHHGSIGGYLQVSHPVSGAITTVAIAGGDTSATISVEFNAPQSGPQEFHLLYKSGVSETALGHFHAFTAIGNQVAVRDGSLTVAANAGRQFWAMQLTGTNVDAGNPIAPGGFHWYQIGRVNPIVNVGGGQHADGYLITWPDVETNPPILRSTSTFVQQAGNYVQADIFPLSWIALRSVAMQVTANAASQVPMVYAHDLAASVSGLPRAQRAFAGGILEQAAATAVKFTGFLGCVASSTDPILKVYASEEKGVVTLALRFRAFAYVPTDANPQLTISVVEVLPGGTFNPLITRELGAISLPLVRPRRSFNDATFSILSLNGVNLGEGEWGMADASFSNDLLRWQPVETSLTFTAERWDTGALYAIQVDTTAPIYVTALYLGGE